MANLCRRQLLRSSCNVPEKFCPTLTKLQFVDRFSWESPISNFAEIRPVWAAVIQADRRTDVHYEATRRYRDLHERAQCKPQQPLAHTKPSKSQGNKCKLLAQKSTSSFSPLASSMSETYWSLKFYVVRTVHFGMKLYNDQRNAQVFNLFIYLLLTYMFRAFFLPIFRGRRWLHTQETWTTAEVVYLPLKMG
jgi:hypothetical protein